MPLITDFNVSPYWDDYDPSKDYYKVLFKPGVAIQARELNQFQTILQNQIEQFGDNIYKTGTIIQGCNPIFYTNYPYIKILDSDINGIPIDVFEFAGLNLVDSSNLIATVVNEISGFESTDPNLNTLYISYLNSGVSQNLTAFTAGEVITAYDRNNIVEKIIINNGSSLFNNSDFMVISSSLAITNSTGGLTFANGTGGSNTFNIGDTLNYVGTSNVRATIISINSTANVSVLILSIVPVLADLEATNTTPSNWTFTSNTSAYDLTTNTNFLVSTLVGGGASATFTTDGFGAINFVSVTSPGAGYYVPPQITVQSATGNIPDANIVAQNYLTKFRVSNTTNAVGAGYAFGITSGVIYQKGYFSRVPQSIVIVDKYNTVPDQLVVGFDTQETIITSNIDQSLLDNAQGTPNYTAPGADRLQLTPILIVQNTATAAANALFFPIVQWSGGLPFQQVFTTQFNSIEEELAQRTEETDGSFVVDEYFISTKSPLTLANEANNYLVYISPGIAYVDGYRTQAFTSFGVTDQKGTNTQVLYPNQLSLTYGNYVLVDNYGGTFEFQTAQVVSLRDTAASFTTNSAALTVIPAAVGNEIGTARIRSILYDNRAGSGGLPGTPAATYRFYLFDINMNAGKNFNNVLSIFANGTFTGVADVAVTGLNQPSNNSLIIPLGTTATKSVANIQYTYRGTSTVSVNTSGYVVATSASGETFLNTPSVYFDTVLAPQANLICPVAAGTVSVTATQSNVTGSSTTFTTAYQPGDYIEVTDGTNVNVRRILYIANNTSLTVDSPFTFSNTGSNSALTLLESVPVSLIRVGRTVNFNGANTTLTINLSNTFGSTTNVSLTSSYVVVNATPISKTVTRNVLVQLNLSNNAGGVAGPWLLGVSDVIRLDAVYRGTSTANDNITSNFFINGGENENFVDLCNTSIISWKYYWSIKYRFPSC